MSTHRDGPVHAHGSIGYLQLPALDVAASAAFYREVVGWEVETDFGSFEGPGVIGQLTTDLAPSGTSGPVLWLGVGDLWTALVAVDAHGGTVVSPPVLDQGERWLVEVDDPAGNRIGLVARAGAARAQPLLVVEDVVASSRWYQRLLGLTSGHGGPEYERLLAEGEIVLQLHHRGTDHHHGPIAEGDGPVGSGVAVWFGDVSDFDGVVERAAELRAPVDRAPHRNPPEGNGPAHREVWLRDPDGYLVVVASPDGEAWVT